MAADWVDYLVSAVRYENENNPVKIAYLKVHRFIEDEIESGYTWTRQEVLNALINGKSFFTVSRDQKGRWRKGRKLFFIRNNGNLVLADEGIIEVEKLNGVMEM
jgi:hypothetical protein